MTPAPPHVRGYGEGEFAAADCPASLSARLAICRSTAAAPARPISARPKSLDIEVSGCGTTTAGDVAGDLDLDAAGSGDIRTGAAQSLDADVAGSADVEVGAVSTSAPTIDIAGSGSVTIASLTGELNTDSAGSGSVSVQGGAVTVASDRFGRVGRRCHCRAGSGR